MKHWTHTARGWVESDAYGNPLPGAIYTHEPPFSTYPGLLATGAAVSPAGRHAARNRPLSERLRDARRALHGQTARDDAQRPLEDRVADAREALTPSRTNPDVQARAADVLRNLRSGR